MKTPSRRVERALSQMDFVVVDVVVAAAAA